ncbi:PD-(D/E)XK nuclease family protein, partial [Arthrospira platensis SPKY2]
MHTIYKNLKGEEVPSVTTVLKVLNKPALVSWANSLGFKRQSYKRELERTAKVGTLVHAYAEEKFNKKLFRDIKKAFELDDFSREQVLSAYNGFKMWLRDNVDLEVIASEKQLVSNKNKYGGTIDLIAKLGDETYIVDFKTSAKVHSTMFLQLAAYVYMAEENGIKIDRVGIVRLSKNKGNYEF